MRLLALPLLALLAAATSAHAEWTGGSVKLGVLTDLSGVYSDATGTGSILATQMAVNDCLAAECKGMTIDIISADHQNKPDVALAIARDWIDNKGVDALVDMSNAAIQLAVPPLVRDKNRVALFAGGTARLSGDACEPQHIVQWMWDTYVQVAGVARRLTKPGTTWYLVEADYALGKQFEEDTNNIVGAAGGKVLGVARHPFPGTDMSSFLLQAQASGADIVALANAGGDTLNGLKTANEFGIGKDRQKLVAYYVSVLDIKGLGLPVAAGTVLTEGFYWDVDAGTRAFSQRFFAKQNAMPSQIQAGLYSATRHYLKAVADAKSRDAETAIRRMHSLPISDDVVRNAHLRPDGRMVHDYYVFQVKKPSESKSAWDLYTLIDTVPGNDAFRPMTPGLCPKPLN